jgi:tryptophan-rich sensory protein
MGDANMKQRTWKIYAIWIALTEAVGILSGILSRSGSEAFSESVQQPPLSPPSFLFPIVWTILYTLMGIGAARVSMAPDLANRQRGLNLFIVQLIINFFWSLFFFNAQAFGFAFLWLVLLWVLVFLMIRAFGKVDQTAAKLQIPYLVWLTFAAYLNFGVWLLNR